MTTGGWVPPGDWGLPGAENPAPAEPEPSTTGPAPAPQPAPEPEPFASRPPQPPAPFAYGPVPVPPAYGPAPVQPGDGPVPVPFGYGPAPVRPGYGPDPQAWMRPVRPARTGPAQAWLPRPYHQLLRGPTFRWWRPLASLGVGVGVLLALMLLIMGVAALWAFLDVATGGSPATAPDEDAWSVTPVGMLVTNLILAALIPISLLAVWGGFGWRPRWVSSVVGGVRWGWLGISYLIAGGIMLGIAALEVLLAGEPGWDAEPEWVWLAVVVVTTTPLQAAGEEYLFRGWLPQAIGSWFARPVVAALVGSTIATVLFALAHGQQDPWLFADRFLFGVVASYLVWRTGGLEAAIAAHGVNNLIAFGLTIATGELSESVNASESSPIALVYSIGTLAIMGAGILLAARTLRVTRLFTPPPAPSAAPLGV